jgi:hypothetical protein
MKLTVKREVFQKDFTLGSLWIDGKFFCFTVEDEIREKKVMHETAIPYGKYKLGWHNSPRFKQKLPHVLDVPGFSYILIHAGNTEKDTSGCLIIGMGRTENGVSQSRIALAALLKKLEGQKEVTIEYVR